jgi:ubiquitin C-terminal hydrolase
MDAIVQLVGHIVSKPENISSPFGTVNRFLVACLTVLRSEPPTTKGLLSLYHEKSIHLFKSIQHMTTSVLPKHHLDDQSQLVMEHFRTFLVETLDALGRTRKLSPTAIFDLTMKDVAEFQVKRADLLLPPNDEAASTIDQDKGRDDFDGLLSTEDLYFAGLKACTLQFQNALIHSSSVDLRNRGTEMIGIEALNTYLNKYGLSTGSSKLMHRYLAKFLHANDITAYLYGPQSHATLIDRTYNIVGFLALTHNLRKSDADLIWSVFVNSQQPDNAQNAGKVLLELVKIIPDYVLRYFCSKFRDMPLSQFSKAAEMVLDTLASKLRGVANSKDSDVSYMCICLLDKLTDVGVTANMQDHLLAFLGSIIMQSSSLEGTGQQIELVEICAKHIVSHSTKATGYVQALMSLTRQKTFSVQPQELLLRLSFSQCGEELIHFLDRTRSGECTLTRHALMCRVELVFHLLSISGPEVDTIPMEMNLWDHLVGQHTLSPEIRDMGWYFLDLHLRSGHPGLEPFYRRCISQYLPNLSVDLVTLGTRKMFFLQARRERENPDILVPLESDLIRFALFCPALNVAHHFMAMLAEFLFNEKAIKSPDLAAAHQVAVVKQCVARLSSNDISSDRAVVVVKTILIASYEFEKTIGLAEKSIPDAHHDNTGAVGDSIQIPIRVHKGGAQSQSTVITVNKTASCSELSAAIAEETGFQSYTTITAGRQIDFAEKPDQSITQLGLKEGNLLIVQKRNTLQSIQDDTNKHVGRTAVEKELLSHLDILYSILDEPTFRATEALIILSHMRYPGPIRAMMADPETTFDEKFPFTTSPRLRTSLEVLHMQFREQVALGVADEKFLLRGVHLLIQLLHRDDLLRDVFDTLRTADILFDFLRERPPVNDAPEEYFEDPSKFIFRILDLLKRSQHDIGPQSSKPVLIRALYQCLMESVMLSPTVRAIFLAAEKDAKVHLSLLLHSNDYIRGTTSATIGSMIQQERTSSDVRSFFSSIFLNHLIPAAMGQPTTCESLFAVAIDNFSSDPNINGDPVKLRFLIEEFSKTLLSLQHCENYGDSLVDKRVQGFISLLCCCIRRLKYLNTPLNLDELASRVFTRLLFPPPETSSLVKPIVSLETRRIVYELLRLMCEDVQTVETLAANCQSVLKYSAIPEDFMFPGPERFVRSEGNYAGLDNLSQTCYMNSLIQQLFMNIQFRKFVFDTRVVDEEKQAVLREFKIAFARMQDSHGVSYRPEALAKALNVDHLVQDDAHIFFMTMIGKLEDSMPDNEAKNTMKGFFRGVNKSQTIGSCKHVSESTDEYFNLSLVVKDKSTLEESLEEYIKGAVLEGSDRFRCTTCGSGDGVSVDAVRRTALDHIPDNLVLGLRRFRYETYDGGSKVNDRFDFPERIDMSKYKLNRLAGVEGSGESDVFQLVGVVVHQGTLAYGHYWSYAAERGPTASNLLPWYRLEDSFVTRSSIADVLRETCGGPESTTNPLNRDLRSDNAYVLFYQRTSSVEDAANCLATSITKSPTAIHAKIRLPEDLEDEISKENEQMLHILNLFSTEHIEFVRGLAGRLEEVKKSDSARNVKVASNIMFTLFAYYSRVVTRSFSPESIDYTSQVLQKFACSDKRFALWTLQQIFPQGDDFDGGLLLHKKQMVRYATSRLVMACLTYLRVTDPVFYGLEEDEYAEVTDSFNLESVISGLYDLLDFLHDCRPSTWREYFDLVGAIAELGTRETFMLLEFGFLGWCLEVLLLRDTPYLHEKHEKMLLYLNDWGRRVEFAAIFKCVYSLLHKYVDFHGGPAASLSSRVDSRSTLASGWQLTEDEHALLTHPHGSTECNWFMHYLLQRLARPQENN